MQMSDIQGASIYDVLVPESVIDMRQLVDDQPITTIIVWQKDVATYYCPYIPLLKGKTWDIQ